VRVDNWDDVGRRIVAHADRALRGDPVSVTIVDDTEIGEVHGVVFSGAVHAGSFTITKES